MKMLYSLVFVSNISEIWIIKNKERHSYNLMSMSSFCQNSGMWNIPWGHTWWWLWESKRSQSWKTYRHPDPKIQGMMLLKNWTPWPVLLLCIHASCRRNYTQPSSIRGKMKRKRTENQDRDIYNEVLVGLGRSSDKIAVDSAQPLYCPLFI